jgi:flagellar hook-length control protein FliK
VDRERLAAYVAGELEADEHARIAARLARDPALRAEVARLEAAERALGRLGPATPSEGFEERLRDAVAPALDEALAADAAAASDPASAVDRGAGTAPRPGGEPAATSGAGSPPEGPAAWAAGADELAARRRPGRWVTAAVGAAAAVALLGVAGVALLGLPGGDDAAPDVAMEATDDAGDEQARLSAELDGPVVRRTDRDLGADDLGGLVAEPALDDLRARALDLGAGSDLARAFTSQLREGAPFASADDEEAAESGPVDADDAEPAPEGEQADEPAAGPESADAGEHQIVRCLDVLLEGSGDPPPIPAYVETFRYEGEQAIAYGLLTPGGDGEAYDRIEVWVVERADCQVRELRQDDGR